MSARTEELQGKIEDENDPDDIMMYIMLKLLGFMMRFL